MIPARHHLVLLAALALAAAACTGASSPTTSPASTTTTTTTSAPDDLAPTTTTSTTAPAPTTTNAALDPPYLLAFGQEAGTTAVFDTESTYRLTTSGDLITEAITVEVAGRRRHAAFGAEIPDVVEVLVEARSIDVFGTRGEAEEDVSGRGRLALLDAGLTPVALDLPVTLVVDRAGAIGGGLAPVPGGTAEPLSLARALDAFPGPPPPPGPVEVGDEWAVGPLDMPWIGTETMTAEGTARVTGTSRVAGAFVVQVEVDLAVTAATVALADVAAALLELTPTEARIAGIDRLVAGVLAAEADQAGAAGTVGVSGGRISGVYGIDPARGIVAAIDTDSRLVVDLALEDDQGPFGGSYVIESRTSAELTGVEDGAPPLPVDPDDAAFAAIAGEVAGYVHEDLDPGRAEELLNRLGLLLDDPLAGVAGTRLAPDDPDAPGMDVLAFYPLGFARGDPALADSVAAVVTGEIDVEVGEPIDLGGAPGLRFESEGETWLVAATNTRLLVAVGGDDVPVDAFTAVVAANLDEHRWQLGECHDLGTDDTFDPPFAPFGAETLVPCYRPHSAEVSGAVLLDDGPDAEFPADLGRRSDRFCGEAFHEFTGSLSTETRITGVSYLPDEAEWAGGDRYLACVVSPVDDDGRITTIAGTLRGAGPADPLVLAPGTCFDGPLGSAPVDCTGPHVSEVIGAIRFDEPPGAPYPGEEEFFAAADERCQAVLEAYADRTVREGTELEAAALAAGVFAWEQGVREYTCTARARNSAGEVVRVTRSFAEQWRPLGPADDAFSA